LAKAGEKLTTQERAAGEIFAFKQKVEGVRNAGFGEENGVVEQPWPDKKRELIQKIICIVLHIFRFYFS